MQFLYLATAMSRPGIVIVGPERAGKLTLIAGLQQLNGPDAATGPTVGWGMDALDAFRGHGGLARGPGCI